MIIIVIIVVLIVIILSWWLVIDYADSQMKLKKKLLPTPRILVEACDKIGIPYEILNRKEIIINDRIKFRGAISNLNPKKSVAIAINKRRCSTLLNANGIPVPKFQAYPGLKSQKDVDHICDDLKISYPLVVKPACGQSGIQVHVGIQDETELRNVLNSLRNLKDDKIKCDEVMIEEFCEGDNYRFLFLDDKLLDVVMRREPIVIGDGKSTLMELISNWNRYRKTLRLYPMKVDWNYLSKNGYTDKSIIGRGKKFSVKQICGSCVFDHIKYGIDKIHPKLIENFKRIGEITGLRLYGLDVMATDLSKLGNAKINEVNSAPSMRVHYFRDRGYLDKYTDLDIPIRFIKILVDDDYLKN